MFTLTSLREEDIQSLPRTSYEDFLSWPKVELKTSEDLSMLAQRIRKFLKTNQFLLYWLTEIQSDSALYGRENEESICLVSFNMWFCA